VEEGSLSRTLAFTVITGYAQEEHAMKREPKTIDRVSTLLVTKNSKTFPGPQKHLSITLS